MSSWQLSQSVVNSGVVRVVSAKAVSVRVVNAKVDSDKEVSVRVVSRVATEVADVVLTLRGFWSRPRNVVYSHVLCSRLDPRSHIWMEQRH